MENLSPPPSEIIFNKSDIWGFFRQPVEKIQVSSKSGKKSGYFNLLAPQFYI
jgi:hypothetical protein